MCVPRGGRSAGWRAAKGVEQVEEKGQGEGGGDGRMEMEKCRRGKALPAARFFRGGERAFGREAAGRLPQGGAALSMRRNGGSRVRKKIVRVSSRPELPGVAQAW